MSEYSVLRLVNAMVVGYRVGTREVMGTGGVQAIANLACEYAGREVVRGNLKCPRSFSGRVDRWAKMCYD